MKLVDSVSAMVAYWTSSLRCVFANRAYERWFGVDPAALVGKHISELLGDELYALNKPYIDGALRGERQEFERELPDPAGGPSRHSLASYIPDVVDGVVQGFFVLVTDVSRVKRVESALRESEELLVLTIEAAPIGMALVAPDGKFLRVNRALCELVDYTAEELTGLPFSSITHPDDIDADLALAAQLARGEIPRYQLEKRYVRKDASVVDVLVSRSMLRDGNGALRYFITQIQDITERKRARDALQQSQERFELALEGADLASWDWNVETGEVVYNARWGEMRGYRAEEIRPHVDTWISGLHPGDRPRIDQALAACFEGTVDEYETEHRVRTKSGEWLWLLDRGKVFARDRTGRPTRMVGTELDITERKRATDKEKLLAEAGRILGSTLNFEDTLKHVARLALNQLADCVFVDVIADSDRIERLVVVHADPTKGDLCTTLEGFLPDRERNRFGSVELDWYAPLLVDEVDDDLVESIAQNATHLNALRALAPRSLMVVPLRGRGRLLGNLFFVASSNRRRYDTRDLELASELARRASLAIDNARLYESAQRAKKTRDEVLGIVAHDLRNPLAAIRMQASLLERREAESGDRRLTDVIVRAAKRMDRLIEDLLDVTRTEAGHLSLARSSVEVRSILRDCREAAEPLISSAGLQLRLDAAKNLPKIWGDRDRLLQAFENLIGNALKFTERGGAITIAAARQGDAVVFSVADTGIGIAREDVAHVFDWFWQVQRKDVARGAGLGLPIVKGIVEAHGGRMWVESTVGKGTTFFFAIPVALMSTTSTPSVRRTDQKRAPSR